MWSPPRQPPRQPPPRQPPPLSLVLRVLHGILTVLVIMWRFPSLPAFAQPHVLQRRPLAWICDCPALVARAHTQPWTLEIQAAFSAGGVGRLHPGKQTWAWRTPKWRRLWDFQSNNMTDWLCPGFANAMLVLPVIDWCTAKSTSCKDFVRWVGRVCQIFLFLSCNCLPIKGPSV